MKNKAGNNWAVVILKKKKKSLDICSRILKNLTTIWVKASVWNSLNQQTPEEGITAKTLLS